MNMSKMANCKHLFTQTSTESILVTYMHIFTKCMKGEVGVGWGVWGGDRCVRIISVCLIPFIFFEISFVKCDFQYMHMDSFKIYNGEL